MCIDFVFVQLLQMLVDSGCSVVEQNYYGATPLHVCAKRDHIECARIIIPKYTIEDLVCICTVYVCACVGIFMSIKK